MPHDSRLPEATRSHRPMPLARLQSRYGGRYRYHWSRLLAFAAMDAAAATLPPIARLARLHAADDPAPAPRRILAIRVDGIGDVVATLPALDALRAGYPSAEIDLLTSPPGGQLMAGDPRVDRVLVDRFLFQDASRGRNRAAPTLREWLPTIRQLRSREYDLAIDFRGDVRTIFWLAYGSGARRRLSWFNTSAGRPLLTDGLEAPGPLHEVQANLMLIGALGLRPVTHYPRLEVPPAQASAAEARLCALGLPPGRPRVGFHCFAISPLRTWPAERFARVMEQLQSDPGARPLLLGSRAEEPAADALLTQTSSNAASLVGQTSLQELVAILSRLDLVVCLDSGLLHLAAAVGTPTVSLFGPGDPARWSPQADGHVALSRGLPCSPCRDVTCLFPTNRCLQEIGVEEVVSAARRQLAARSRVQPHGGVTMTPLPMF